jgi:glycosyltransferase involved in cell wall biosynthesis
MRILFVAQTFAPVVGGAERYIAELSREMARKGAEVTVLAPDFRHNEMGKGLPKEDERDGYRIIRANFRYTWKRKLLYHMSSLPFGRDLKRVMERTRPDIVHFQYPCPFGTLYGQVRMAKALPFCSSHGSEILFLQRDPIGRRLFKQVLENMEAVFTMSNECTDLIRKGTTSKANFKVFFSGTRPEYFRPLDGGAPEGPPVILSASRLARRKGIDIVIDAFDMISKGHDDAQLHIVGDGPERKGLEKKASKVRHPDRIRFLGKVSDEALLREYQTCAVYVLASRTIPNEDDIEGLGLTLLEAMACERPVIGSTAGGVPSAIREGPKGWGLLFKEGGAKDLAKKLEKVLSDRDAADAMGEWGRKAVETIYNWDVITDKMLEVYSTSLRRRRRRPS